MSAKAAVKHSTVTDFTIPELKSLKAPALDALHKSCPDLGRVTNWDSLKLPQKIQTALGIAYPIVFDVPAAAVFRKDEQPAEQPAKKKAPHLKVVPDKPATDTAQPKEPSDFIIKTAEEIKNLNSQNQVETAIIDCLEQEPEGDFKLGGLFSRLNEIGNFGDHKNFKQYVEERFNVKYRKARYLINIYQKLVEIDVPWDDVKNIGWTKLKLLLGVLTAENASEWIDRALSMNLVSLEEAVKQAKQDGETNELSEEAKVSTKTFRLSAEQEEVIQSALDQAKETHNLGSESIALESICLDYHANVDGPQSVPQTAVAEYKERIKSLEEQVKKLSEGKTLPLDTIYKSALTDNEGKVKETLTELFGEPFEKVFPQVKVSFSKIK